MYEKREQNPEPEVKETVLLDQRLACDSCGKGHYDELVLLDKVYGTCDTCGERKRLK